MRLATPGLCSVMWRESVKDIEVNEMRIWSKRNFDAEGTCKDRQMRWYTNIKKRRDRRGCGEGIFGDSGKRKSCTRRRLSLDKLRGHGKAGPAHCPLIYLTSKEEHQRDHGAGGMQQSPQSAYKTTLREFLAIITTLPKPFTRSPTPLSYTSTCDDRIEHRSSL